MMLAVETAREPINVFNLGRPDALRVHESVAIITRTMKLEPRIEYLGGVRGWVGDSPRIVLDTARIQALGWKATKSLEESVVETLRFLMASPFVVRRETQTGEPPI